LSRGLLLGALLALALALPAGAYPPITCGRMTVDGATLVVRTHGPSCAYAKRWVRSFAERRRAPKGWTCRAYGSALPVHCAEKRHKLSRYFSASPPA
jgi:hypothetical protein